MSHVLGARSQKEFDMDESTTRTDGRAVGEGQDAHEDSALLTRSEAASLLRVKPTTLSQWAYRGTGPRFFRPDNGRALYRRRDLDSWLAGGEVVPGCVGPREAS